ncbi:hypothetical protein C4B38_000356 [Diabrotica virgifera virgifera]|uniref:Cytochrome P450 9e2-like n=1 Tax=Diabrotica virgifera virgifera TaxID=50390 RepID=A0A6P7GMM0_DIAVI|nr:hypothetical protein C4B38_000356 [Diabrotica virgifera virgifera]
MTDQTWRDMRSILSPLFTSSKLKIMYNLMSECAENVTKYFRNQKDGVFEVTMKDLSARYANDIIATTAMGFQVDSIGDPENVFYKMAKIVSNLSSFWRMIVKLEFYEGESRRFFRNLIKDAVYARKAESIVRPNMIHLMIQAQNKLKEKPQNSDVVNEDNNLEITMEDITAHALIFFIAGFESSSGLMCYMAYELVVNPDIQTRLRQEIDEAFEECNGTLSYEAVMKMKYLDMVVSETMRKWPNFVSTDRVCTKEYTIKAQTAEEIDLIIEKGTVLQLPIYAIQNDPKNFPDPQRFDPERFSAENKDRINPYAYIPFGVGPRVCIGTRFALMQTKIFFAHLLHEFEIIPTTKTKIPFEISKKSFNLSTKDGIHVALKKLVT